MHRIWPCRAWAMIRAARLTPSPMTVKLRRSGGPISPTNSGARWTPTRTLTGPSTVSTISRTARSIRSSASSAAKGTPEVRMIFPPSLSMSLLKKATS